MMHCWQAVHIIIVWAHSRAEAAAVCYLCARLACHPVGRVARKAALMYAQNKTI